MKEKRNCNQDIQDMIDEEISLREADEYCERMEKAMVDAYQDLIW